jgi:hypothetical protein
MDKKISSFITSRRQFLTNILPAGTLFCLGCSNLLAIQQSQDKPKVASEKHKFLQDSGMTYQQVFQFAYGGYISIMQELVNDGEKDKFIEMLKKASSEATAKSIKQRFKDLPKRDIAAIAKMMTGNPFYKNTLTYEIVEQSDKAFEVKISECLYAKTFRGAKEPNAADIGYASLCHSDFAFIRAFNPKIKLIRTKTLMQGHDCCNHRYVLES